MELLEKITAIGEKMIGVLSESAAICLFFAAVFTLPSIISIRCIISGLNEMHRSRTAQKKLYKEYSFRERTILKPAWQKCLHAQKFCRFLIVYHHSIAILFLIELLLAVFSCFFPVLMQVIACFTLIFSIFVCFPVLILSSTLDRYPFQKFKHEFTFRKYHNTDDHNSLW